MSNDKMREEFEAIWGFTNEEQECYFMPELNCYGSRNSIRIAESKSVAWKYFQKGWSASRENLLISIHPCKGDLDAYIKAIESAGAKANLVNL